MNNFKDQISADIGVFINPDELGEPKSIDGEEVIVVVGDDLVNGRYRSFGDGTFASRITFFVRESDLGYMPVKGQDMRFGDVGERGYPYIVTNVSSDMGVLGITIEADRT